MTPTPDAPPAEPLSLALELESPEVTVEAGQQVMYCWHFQTSNIQTLAIRRWVSSMPVSGASMTLYLMHSPVKPAGTLTAADCTPYTGDATATLGDMPAWMYSTQQAEETLDLPRDGETPLAMEVGAMQYGFLQMRFANTTGARVQARMKVSGYVNPELTEAGYTKTASFVTYNGDIAIPPGATDYSQSDTCAVSPDSKFWMMSSQTHRRANGMFVLDGMPDTGEMVYQSVGDAQWAQPEVLRWPTAPFHTFASGKLSYTCRWNNPTERVIEAGANFATDEQCIAAGYYFPATRPVFCYNNARI